MLLTLLSLAAGLVVLSWGADRFIAGAAALARHLGVSPLVVGVTVVGFGTSAPEILVSALAAWEGNTAMALGNAVGSNIANTGLIIGATALVAPLTVRSQTLGRELPLMLAVMIFVLLLLWDGALGRFDASLLLLALAAVLYGLLLIVRAPTEPDPLGREFAQELPPDAPAGRAWLRLALGLAGLLVGSRMLVLAAVTLAKTLGISDLVIGLTVVAVGTSLPELAASLASALKREHDIAVGNVIGSNMFNLLAVMGVAAMLSPGAVDEDLLRRDYPVMLGLSLAFFVLAYRFLGGRIINRAEGGVLLLAFAVYEVWLYVSA